MTRRKTPSSVPAKKRRPKRKGRKPGPRRHQPTPCEVLRRRGKEKQPKLGIDRVEPVDAPAPPIPSTRRAWVKLLREIPGFDPFADADDFWFDEKTAHRAISFFHNELRHFKGEFAGQPFYLERWQMAIIANVFGWMTDDGLRRFRYLFLLVGRKNGKTPLMAGICLYALFGEDPLEPGAEIYSAAREYKQAGKVFDYAYGMLIQNSRLLSLVKPESGGKLYTSLQLKAMIRGPETGGSYYMPIASDPETAYSSNTYIACIDELFTQPNRLLVDAIETSTANRRSPLIVYITTADFARESICNEKHDYAISIRDQGGDPSFLPVLYAADDDANVLDERQWRKANPNFEVSVTRKYMETEARKASRDSAYANTFKRLHLCIRTDARERALPADAWGRCGLVEFTEADLAGQVCYAGLDLASTAHSNALALVFRTTDDAGKIAYRVLTWFWLPEATVRDWEIRGQGRYRRWADLGFLRTTPGNVTDYGFIRRDINEIATRFRIEEIAVDRLYQGAQLCTDLQSDGFTAIAFGQGFYSMAGPTKDFRDLVLDGRLWHGNHPVLDWHASNMSVAIDPAGCMKPDRSSRHAAIDGCVSCIMALGRAALAKDDGDFTVRSF